MVAKGKRKARKMEAHAAAFDFARFYRVEV